MEDVCSCACLIQEVGHVNVAEGSTGSTPLPVRPSLPVALKKNPAMTVANASAAKSSVTDSWTVLTSQMNGTVSFHTEELKLLRNGVNRI